MWEGLYRRLTIELPPGFEPTKTPSREDLDCFEKGAGIRLPKSYRAFVQIFGPGTLGGYFKINSPGYDGLRNVDLARTNELMHEGDEDLAAWYGRPDFIRRSINFADSFGGDIIVWDPADLRDARSNEYGIYALPHGWEKGIELAGSFQEFIKHVCLGGKWNELFGGNYTPCLVFEPAAARRKKTRPSTGKKPPKKGRAKG